MIAALDQYVEQHVQASMRELAQLCNQPSVSAQGLGMRECAALIAEMLRTRGIAAQVMETAGHPVVVGEYGTGDRTLLLYNHYDVQPPEPLELWDSPPFEAVQRDGKLFARGAVDDKGHIISRLAAFDAYRAVYGEFPYRIKLLIEGEEEIGSPSLDGFIRAHRDQLAADACVWEAGGVNYEGRPEMYLGLRGIVGVELRLRTMKYDAHSGEQSYLPNAAWRMVWALGTLKNQQERILIPGFYDAVRAPTARQRELLAALPSQEEQEKSYYGVTRFAGDLTGQALKEAVFLPTCTINGLWSGYQGNGSKTIIPAEARCKIDFRLVPDQDPEEVVRQLRAHLDAQGYGDIEIIAEPGEGAGVVDPDSPYIQLALDTARSVFPGHNSWVGEFRGREEVERWVRRVYQVGLRLEPYEILIAGTPWDTTVCLWFTDTCTAPDGTVVYTDQGVIFGKIAWGKITSYELHEDTEKVVALDKYVPSLESTAL